MILHIALLVVAAFIAGAMNAVAGGGSFFTFPALIAVGLDAKMANATNTVAVWPGSIASVGAFRNELRSQREAVRLLSGVSLLGGLAGAVLLMVTPSRVFNILLPYLMLGATLLFAFSPRINQLLRSREGHGDASPQSRYRSIALQGIIAIYGGYFGAGIGILMMATLALMGLEDIHEINALKTFLATLINGIAVVIFVCAHMVVWHYALIMAVASILGGYGGAALSKRVPPHFVRIFVVIVGVTLSGYLFIHKS